MSEPTLEMPPMPTPELEKANLVNALHIIRYLALTHYYGDAFDPEHMAGIAEIASGALLGDRFEPLLTYEEALNRAREKWPNLSELFGAGAVSDGE